MDNNRKNTIIQRSEFLIADVNCGWQGRTSPLWLKWTHLTCWGSPTWNGWKGSGWTWAARLASTCSLKRPMTGTPRCVCVCHCFHILSNLHKWKSTVHLCYSFVCVYCVCACIYCKGVCLPLSLSQPGLHIWDEHHQSSGRRRRWLPLWGHLQRQVWQLYIWSHSGRWVPPRPSSSAI